MNLSKGWKPMVAIAFLTVAASGAWKYALAQTDQNPSPNPPAMRVQRAGGGRGGAVVMAISGSNLFIVRGNVIYRLDADTLQIKKQANLPETPVTNQRTNFRNFNRNNGGQSDQNFRSARRQPISSSNK